MRKKSPKLNCFPIFFKRYLPEQAAVPGYLTTTTQMERCLCDHDHDVNDDCDFDYDCDDDCGYGHEILVVPAILQNYDGGLPFM